MVSMISGIIAAIDRLGEPTVGIDPGHRFAGREIEDMRAATEAVETRPGAGVGVLKAPSAGEMEFGGAAYDELADAVRCEPVSGSISLAAGKNTGNFAFLR